MLPLDLRVREVASLYEAKKGAVMPELCDRGVETMAPAEEAPHPAEHRTIMFNTLVDEEQYVENNSYETRIFTDGSKIEGEVGAALSVWDRAVEIRSLKLSLPSYCTVYQVELLALCKAAEDAHRNSHTNIGIFSVSRSALESVVNPSSSHPLAVRTRELLKNCANQNKQISLFWIKAHAGLEGNERADQLAKEAALRAKRRHDYDSCPVSYIKCCIRRNTIDEWDRRYRTESTASGTKLFLPNAKTAYKIVRKMDINHLTTQILTGHGGFSSYLNRFRCKESPSCECYLNVEETVEHLLLSCPIFNSHRFDLEGRLDMKINKEVLPTLMLGIITRDKLLEYAIKIVTRVINRNK